jgi:hypothetical protein
MGQVTIYLPDEVERRVRRDAKRAGKSLSAFIADRVEPEAPTGWPKEFIEVLGTWEGELNVGEDPPPPEPPSFD